MEMITIYKLLGLLALCSLLVMLLSKKPGRTQAFFSMLFKILTLGYYFMTFFVKNQINLIPLMINYILLLTIISLFIMTFILKKYITKNVKGVTGLIFLVSIIGLIINGFFV